MKINIHYTKLKRKPERTVVGHSTGKIFNEVVVLDVGELEGVKFLVMVNLVTHTSKVVDKE